MSNENDAQNDPNAPKQEGATPGADPGAGVEGSGSSQNDPTVAASNAPPAPVVEGTGTDAAGIVEQKAEDAIPSIGKVNDLAALDEILKQESEGKKRKTVLEAIEARKLELQTNPPQGATPGALDDDDTIDGSTVVNPPSRSQETDDTLKDIDHQLATGQRRPVIQGQQQLPATVQFDGQTFQVYQGPCDKCVRQDQAWDYVQVDDPNHPGKKMDVRVAVCEHKKVS